MITFTPDEWKILAGASEDTGMDHYYEREYDEAIVDLEIAAKVYGICGDYKSKTRVCDKIAEIELKKSAR